MGENVYIIGVGMIKFGKHFEKSTKDMTGEALKLVEGRRESNLSRRKKKVIQYSWIFTP